MKTLLKTHGSKFLDTHLAPPVGVRIKIILLLYPIFNHARADDKPKRDAAMKYLIQKRAFYFQCYERNVSKCIVNKRIWVKMLLTETSHDRDKKLAW